MCRCRVSGAEEPAGQQRNKRFKMPCAYGVIVCGLKSCTRLPTLDECRIKVLRHIRLVSKCLYTGPTEVRVTARGGVKSRIPKSSELSYDA